MRFLRCSEFPSDEGEEAEALGEVCRGETVEMGAGDGGGGDVFVLTGVEEVKGDMGGGDAD